MSSSLQSGDLSSAQQAYTAIQKLLPGLSQDTTSSSNPIAQDFQALGKALQSGDLSSAQSDFSQLQTDLSTAGASASSGLTKAHHGHHHHAAPPVDADSTSSTTSSAAASSGGSGQTVNLVG
ncbi:MAG TPA: hypothetical protein VG456_00025 [Candidatus Sulfopaludibacter sp.]|nr:hypothetical protein [Candidatus Sulfopaludibacter sp.]